LVFAARAIEIGAKGYVRSPATLATIVEAIREVGKRRGLSAGVDRTADCFCRAHGRPSPLSKLTPREVEILRLLSVGKSCRRSPGWSMRRTKRLPIPSSIIRQKLGLRHHPSSCALRSSVGWPEFSRQLGPVPVAAEARNSSIFSARSG